MVMINQIENDQKEVGFNLHQIAKAFKALAEPTRVRMLLLLLQQECCVYEVEQALGLSQTRTSRSLKALYDAGFLKLKKTGLWSHYSVCFEGMPQPILGILEAVGAALGGNPIIAEDQQQLARVREKTANRKSDASVKETAFQS